jgi:transcriptional regulator GlxA family with amidase domain
MKNIAILLPKGPVMPSGVVGAYFLLTQANEFCRAVGRSAPFSVRLLGYDTAPLNLYDGFVNIRAHGRFEDEPKNPDLVLVPGFTGDMEVPLIENTALIGWLKACCASGNAELASICTGAFLVAATGLADGKKATTHWAFADDFRRRFPRVKLQPDNILTDDRGIYTSAGAYSSLNLVLYLVEKFCGKDTAVWLSKVYQIDPDRNSQKPFAIFNLQKKHNDDPISQVQQFIEQHFEEALSVQLLAKQFAFSRRNFVRRFKDATGNTPIEYIQRVRIEAAKRLLEQSPKGLNEIMGESGYHDGKTFRAIFKKYTGLSPGAYRGRYAQKTAPHRP